MRLEELRDELAFLLGFKSDQVSQDFRGTSTYPYKRIDSLLNQARRLEYNNVVQECGSEVFAARMTFSWAATDATKTLPDGLSTEQLIGLYDVTAAEPGWPITVGVRDSGHDVVWESQGVLRWGQNGPGEDKTVLAHYVARPRDLENPTDECVLLPEHFQDVYVWSAGILARTTADESAPPVWAEHRKELREQIVLSLSKRRPLTGGIDSVAFTTDG